MLNKYSTLVLGAMLGLGTLAFTGASASAAAMLPLSSVSSDDAQGVNGGIVQVDHKKKKGKKKKWKNRHFSRHCNYEFGGCGNFYPRYRYHAPYLSVPLIIGGGYGGYNDYDDYAYDDYDGGGLSSRHVRYCLNKYQSYNLRNNTWVSFSGRVRQCRSPYM